MPMPDFHIEESKGYEELDDFHALVAEHGFVDELWKAAGQRDLEVIRDTLEAMGYLEEGERVRGFRMLALPDDILGEHLRAWVKASRR